jgi:hypothetical protein
MPARWLAERCFSPSRGVLFAHLSLFFALWAYVTLAGCYENAIRIFSIMQRKVK